MYKHPQQPSSKPFLKWAGGKQRLLSQLLPLLPSHSRLIEPFVGAGSVFLAADYGTYIINDSNPDLASVWAALKEWPDEFINDASHFFRASNTGAIGYLRVRDEFNETSDSYQRAIRLPYLNKFGFNGLFRVNRQGRYNVLYGKSDRPKFPLAELQAAALKLQRCQVMCGNFDAPLAEAHAGDLVYCDPPYVDSDQGRSFTAYTASGFAMNDQLELVAASRRAVARGATVAISNHDTQAARDLYAGWSMHELSVRRSISARSETRGQAREVLAILEPRG